MPEGDSIWKLAAQLGDELLGLRVLSATIDGQELQVAMLGQAVDDVFAVGKHLFVACGRDAIRSHLGMHGTWHRYVGDDPWQLPQRQARVTLTCEIEDGERCTWVCFHPKEAALVDLAGGAHRRFLRRLGPDLLSSCEAGLEEILERVRAVPPTTTLAELLLDQRVASGIGNVWKSELCFLEAVLPTREIASVDEELLRRLYERARTMLPRNLGPAMRSTRGPSPRSASIRTADDARYWVYRRAKEPCDVCGESIEYARVGRRPRATYWCARCQA